MVVQAMPSPWVAVEAGTDLLAHARQIQRSWDRLLGEGVFAQPVVFPTVAMDKSRLRTIVTAAHSDQQLDMALAAFDRVGRELGLIGG